MYTRIFILGMSLFVFGCLNRTISSDEDIDGELSSSENYTSSSSLEEGSSSNANDGANSSSEDVMNSSLNDTLSSAVDPSSSSMSQISSSHLGQSSSQASFSSSQIILSSFTSLSSSSNPSLSSSQIQNSSVNISSSSDILSSSTMISSSSTLIDTTVLLDSRDGQTYEITWIGDQVWMAENLNYDLDECYDCERNGQMYPASYVRQVSLCPEGWHVPSHEEWDDLADFIAQQEGKTTKSELSWLDIGDYLKSSTTWSGSSAGVDSYGFNAISSGYLTINSRVNDTSSTAMWWTSSSYGANHQYVKTLGKDNEFRTEKIPTSDHLMRGFPVRCLRDDAPSGHQVDSTYADEFYDIRDGKTYAKTKIGTQSWMAENLDYYVNELNRSCPFDDSNICDEYGAYYTLNTALASCPHGWTLPTKDDWEVLGDYLLGTYGGSKVESGYWLEVSQYLKAPSGWSSYPGNNSTGFNAIQGSGYTSNLNNGKQGYGEAYYWGTDGVVRKITDQSNELYYSDYHDNYTLSVRCIEI